MNRISAALVVYVMIAAVSLGSLYMMVSATTATVAWTPPVHTTAYHPELEWWVKDPPDAGFALPTEFVVQRAAAFVHPYVWNEVARVAASACLPPPGSTVCGRWPADAGLPSRRCFRWVGPTQQPGDPYPWFIVQSMNGTAPGQLVVESPRQEVEIRTDPWP